MKKMSFILAAVLLLAQLPFCAYQIETAAPLSEQVRRASPELRQKGESIRPLTREYLLDETGQAVYDTLLYTLHSGGDALVLTLTQDEYEHITQYLETILTGVFTESVLLPANNIPADYWHHTYNPLTGEFTLEIPVWLLEHLPAYRERHREALSAAAAIIEAIIPADADEHQAARLIYDHIIENVGYALFRECEPDASACTAWDALVRGQAQCEGYAKALVMLYSLLGIESAVVTSSGIDGEPGHAWTVALLEGEHYYIDATNAGGSKSAPGAPPGLLEYGFRMTDAYMQAIPCYDYDPSRTPAFGERVPLRHVLPANTGRRLRESPYYTPNADLAAGDGFEEIKAAFAAARAAGRDWIWVLGPPAALEATGALTNNGDGTFTQAIYDRVPEGKKLHWEWVESFSMIYLSSDS